MRQRTLTPNSYCGPFLLTLPDLVSPGKENHPVLRECVHRNSASLLLAIFLGPSFSSAGVRNSPSKFCVQHCFSIICVCFSLYGCFNCISFHKFSRQLSAFSLCSSGLISALLVLSAIYLFMNQSLLQP